MHTHIHTYTHKHKHIHMHTACMNTCTHANTHTCMYVYTHTHTCMHAHTHTHIHTHTIFWWWNKPVFLQLQVHCKFITTCPWLYSTGTDKFLLMTYWPKLLYLRFYAQTQLCIYVPITMCKILFQTSVFDFS